MRRHLTLAVVAILAVAGSALGRQKVEEEHKINKDAAVIVDGVIAGQIEVIGWDRAACRVEAELEDDVIKLDVDVDPGRIRLKPQYRDEGSKDADIRLVLHVPAGARLSVRAISASTEIRGLARGRIDVQAISGEVDVIGPAESIKVQSVSGAVDIRNPGKEVEAQSVSGSVEVRGDAELVSCESVSGSVEYAGKAKFVDAGPVSGSVTLLLPPGLEMTVDVSTFSGSIKNEFGPEAERSSLGVGNKLEYSTGRDIVVDVSSMSGSVRLKKLTK